MSLGVDHYCNQVEGLGGWIEDSCVKQIIVQLFKAERTWERVDQMTLRAQRPGWTRPEDQPRWRTNRRNLYRKTWWKWRYSRLRTILIVAFWLKIDTFCCYLVHAEEGWSRLPKATWRRKTACDWRVSLGSGWCWWENREVSHLKLHGFAAIRYQNSLSLPQNKEHRAFYLFVSWPCSCCCFY